MSKAPIDGQLGELPRPVALNAVSTARWRGMSLWAVVPGYLVVSWAVANASLSLQSLILVAAVFGILAISLDLVSGMLGLYSLGQGGFFGVGAYVTAIAVANDNLSPFVLLPAIVVGTGLLGVLIGAMSLRVSGLYFAITTFIFTLVLTVMETDMQMTGGTQGLLGPSFPSFPSGLAWLGTALAWCILLALLLATTLVWNLRRSPLYAVLLAIRDAEPFAEAAGVRTAALKIGVFGLSAAMAGGAGWLFSFLGVVSPGQFDWSVSLNVLVMVLVGGINTTLGPLVGAAFVSMFPAVVDINAWLQEILYGALSIFAVTVFPEGVVGLMINRLAAWRHVPHAPMGVQPVAAAAPVVVARGVVTDEDIAVLCRGIEFRYAVGPQVLRRVDLIVKRGHIHGLIGPNGSGKSTLANVIAGRLRPVAGSVFVKGIQVDRIPPSGRARLGLRRTFQAAQLVRELTTAQNVSVGLYGAVRGMVRRAPIWPMTASGRRDTASVTGRSAEALRAVGAEGWAGRRVADIPHGIEQLTQLAAVHVARPDIIILDEPATGLSSREVDHLAAILTELKALGVTMIIIEHQTRFLLPLCDQVTVLNAGEVILTATAEEVRTNPLVRQVYLGE
jgi:branched-chain amino acid transport system permease protein